jgi:hypothetical protein
MSIPVKSRIRFIQNEAEINELIMETGQVQLVDVLTEVLLNGTWNAATASLEASVVSFDGEMFEEMLTCSIEESVVTVVSDLPIGTYYLQIRAVFADGEGFLGYERIQRLKLKVVLDRK